MKTHSLYKKLLSFSGLILNNNNSGYKLLHLKLLHILNIRNKMNC